MRRILAIAFIAVACVAATAGTARAADVITVKVPFAFTVHGQSFPAGSYTIERETPTVLLIRGENGNRLSTFVQTVPAGGHDPAGEMPSLTFKRFENQYKLSAVWEDGREGLDLMN
jgi:hypothetical protein